jgi:formate dehydrogenase subunit beta
MVSTDVDLPAAQQSQQDEQADSTEAESDTSEPQAEQATEQGENNSEEQVPVQAQASSKEQPDTADKPTTPAPIALVLKPCEIRALVELVKLQQASIEPFLVIGVDCWGTYSVQDYAAKAGQCAEGSSVTADFLKEAAAGNISKEIRGACQVCQYPAATYADLEIQLIGEDINKQIRVEAQTEKGTELLNALGLEAAPENNERQGAVAKIKEARKQLAEQAEEDFLETIASLCINCHNCRAVCPICYCKQCVFDGPVFDYPLEKYLNWSDKKGVLPMPPDKLLFHLTRMSHVATSCVACGQCEAACPSGVPLGRIYQKISTAAQEALEYEAGRSLEEELPLTTFREDELSVVED